MKPNPRTLATALWWIALLSIVIGSFAPRANDTLTQLHDAHDDLLHAACYAVLTALRALYEPRRRQLLYLLAAALAGLAIELIQPYFGRAFDPLDILANTAGLLAGALIPAFLRNSTNQP